MSRLVSAHRAGRPLAILLDFDGTLAPIVDAPERAVPVAGAERTLAALMTIPRVLVGLVSGRSLDDLHRRMPIVCHASAGTSGLELEFLGERTTFGDSSETRALLDEVRQKLEPVAQEFPGAWLEVKPLGLTLHYRGVSAESAGPLVTAARLTLVPCAGRVLVSSGPAALEVVPAVGCDKGTAVRMICRLWGEDSLPVYAGDGGNDLAAFAATESLGGVTIAVGTQNPYRATLGLSEPVELRTWLNDLAALLLAESVGAVQKSH